jgi:NAD(P)H-dependent FMN reductase
VPQAKPRIAIIISSTREARFGDKPAQWIHDLAQKRSEFEFEIVDLRDYPLPFFAEATSPAYAPPANETARQWGAKIASFDGFIIVAAEYNHGPTAVLKNALDYAYREFGRKPVAFVGYGGVGAARAIEQLRLVAVELQMAPTRAGVYIAAGDFMALWRGGKSFADLPHLAPTAEALLDDLAWWVRALKTAREAERVQAAA